MRGLDSVRSRVLPWSPVVSRGLPWHHVASRVASRSLQLNFGSSGIFYFAAFVYLRPSVFVIHQLCLGSLAGIIFPQTSVAVRVLAVLVED